jgi:transcription elongation GreA/GreB family factor
LSARAGAQEDPARRRRKRALERDLRYVRARLESAILVDPAAAPRGEIRFGARAVLRRGDGAEKALRLVGEDEAEEGGELVAWTGPFARALLGLKAGQSLEWDAGAGPERWTVARVDPTAT